MNKGQSLKSLFPMLRGERVWAWVSARVTSQRVVKGFAHGRCSTFRLINFKWLTGHNATRILSRNYEGENLNHLGYAVEMFKADFFFLSIRIIWKKRKGVRLMIGSEHRKYWLSNSVHFLPSCSRMYMTEEDWEIKKKLELIIRIKE